MRASPNEYKLAAEGKTAIVTIADNDRWDWVAHTGADKASPTPSLVASLDKYRDANDLELARLHLAFKAIGRDDGVSAGIAGRRETREKGWLAVSKNIDESDSLALKFEFDSISGAISLADKDPSQVQSKEDLQVGLGYVYDIDNTGKTAHSVGVTVTFVASVAGQMTQTEQTQAGVDGGTLKVTVSHSATFTTGIGDDLTDDAFFKLKVELIEDDN